MRLWPINFRGILEFKLLDVDFAFGIGLSASFAAGLGDDVSASRAQGFGRSFTLADNDDGDQFDVKVGLPVINELETAIIQADTE